MKNFSINASTMYEVVKTSLVSIVSTLELCHNNSDAIKLINDIRTYATALGYTKAQYDTLSEELYTSILNTIKVFETGCMKAKYNNSNEIYILHSARSQFIQLRTILNFISIDNGLPVVY